MKKITNLNETNDINEIKKRAHQIKISSNQLVKLAEDSQIPIFVAYYDPQKGYQYNGVFPEELDAEDLASEYGRFYEFLRVCIGFNKADLMPQMKKSEEDLPDHEKGEV